MTLAAGQPRRFGFVAIVRTEESDIRMQCYWRCQG